MPRLLRSFNFPLLSRWGGQGPAGSRLSLPVQGTAVP